jgi:hypothetical protein
MFRFVETVLPSLLSYPSLSYQCSFSLQLWRKIGQDKPHMEKKATPSSMRLDGIARADGRRHPVLFKIFDHQHQIGPTQSYDDNQWRAHACKGGKARLCSRIL